MGGRLNVASAVECPAGPLPGRHHPHCLLAVDRLYVRDPDGTTEVSFIDLALVHEEARAERRPGFLDEDHDRRFILTRPGGADDARDGVIAARGLGPGRGDCQREPEFLGVTFPDIGRRSPRPGRARRRGVGFLGRFCLRQCIGTGCDDEPRGQARQCGRFQLASDHGR